MNQIAPKPLPDVWPSPVKIVFSDIDDTLTWKGQLPTETFLALQNLRDAGIKVVPVTGASAGWADCILRTWPIDTIIAENGSFWMTQDSSNLVTRHFQKSTKDRLKNLERLRSLGDEFQIAFPMINYTDDQDFRITDVAFDIGQQVKIDRDIAIKATKWLNDRGASARLSSIHINVWIGEHSKATAAMKWLEGQSDITLEDCIFIGDSPNDESMFAQFSTSIGVANVSRFLNDMDHGPKYITLKNGGFGFCELAEKLLNP